MRTYFASVDNLAGQNETMRLQPMFLGVASRAMDVAEIDGAERSAGTRMRDQDVQKSPEEVIGLSSLSIVAKVRKDRPAVNSVPEESNPSVESRRMQELDVPAGNAIELLTRQVAGMDPRQHK